jgi:hypothetical protein
MIELRFMGFMIVFQTQLLFSYNSSHADYVFKQINIYLQELPKVDHRTLPTSFSLVQGQALLSYLRVGLQPVSSYFV